MVSLNSISDEPVLCFDDFRLDRRDGLFRRRESGQEQPVTLGSRALDVLMALVERHGTLVTKQGPMDAAWPGMAVEDSNLAVQISSLRRVLDEYRTGGSCIQTVIGRGYRFLPSVAVEPPPGAQATAADFRLSDKAVAEQSVGSTARPHRPSPLVVTLAIALIAIGIGSGALMAWEVWFWHGHTPASAPPSLSLVVLPFDNLGGEPDDDYLVAGVTDDLTTALSHIPGTFVISRATAYSYRGKAEDIRQIGRDLGVRYVVRGSLRRFGSTLRVNAELSSTETGAHSGPTASTRRSPTSPPARSRSSSACAPRSTSASPTPRRHGACGSVRPIRMRSTSSCGRVRYRFCRNKGHVGSGRRAVSAGALA